MTRADLMAGDRPWRVGVGVDPRTCERWGVLGAAVGLVAVLVLMVLVPAVGAVLGAVGACWWFRPSVVLHGGGRRPMSTTEWREWIAHFELTAAEHEHARRAAR